MNAPATHLLRGTTSTGAIVYYTGAAGDGFVSPDFGRAFVGWYLSGAEHKARVLNRGTAFHGITFEPAEADTEALRARILAATTRAELDAIAEDMEGLGCVDLADPADDVTTTVDEARALLLEALEA